MESKNSQKNNSLFLIVALLSAVVLVLLFPKIYNYIEKANSPKIHHENKEEIKEPEVVTEEVLSSLHYPIMRSGIYNSKTYYSLDKFKISNMSNGDILLNAFLDIYEGNMTPYNGRASCTKNSKQFEEAYIQLRIKNILGKNVKYKLENFYVPKGLNSNYAGTWNYDSANSRFIYNGFCNGALSGTEYYDLSQFIKAEYNNRDVIVYSYVGFAKVSGGSYTIYSDANMTNSISSGQLPKNNDLLTVFNGLDNKDKKIYKYVFKNSLCSYNEYCLYEGEWVNEL